jgi:hypothetical protein
MARPRYKSDKAPKVVSKGTVSKPKKLAAWRPGTLVKDAAPRKVQAPL